MSTFIITKNQDTYSVSVQAMAACPGRTSRSSLPKPPPPKAKPAPKAPHGLDLVMIYVE